MKLESKKLNINSDKEDDGISDEETSHEETDFEDNEGQEKPKNNDDEVDKVDDIEDQLEKREVKPKNIFNGKKKIVSKTNQLTKSKKPSTQKLVDEAIKDLNERTGSSLEAIKKFIMTKEPTFDEKRLKMHIKRYIKNCLMDGTMAQIKRSFKLTNKHAAKNKEQEKKKLKAKKEKEGEKLKIIKEKQKQQKTEKPQEKAKKPSSVKTTKTSKTLKDIKKIEKTSKKVEASSKPNKKHNVEQATQDVDSKKIAAKTEKLKSKDKLARKSINVVVRPTLPRPKSIKKLKNKATVSKKTIDLKIEVKASTSAAAAIQSNKKVKKK